MNKPVVSVVDTKGREIYAAVKEAVDLIGGITRFVRPGNLVLLKPNMFIPESDYKTGKITDPRVTIAVARLAKETGGRVVVAERTENPLVIFERYPEIYQYAEVISLDNAPYQHRRILGAESLVDCIPLPDIVNECDVLINIPGLRRHMLTLFSNGMKNLMGLLPGDTTRYIHKYGLSGSIVDLNYYCPSDLVITDAVYSLEGNFPGSSRPVLTEVVMAADNVVAADVAAAVALGHDPREIDFLLEAGERGMGPVKIDDIKLCGDLKVFAGGRLHLQQTPLSYEPFREHVTIIDHAACPACKRALIGGLTDLKLVEPTVYEQLTKDKVTVLVGPLEKEPDIKTARVFCFGNCTYRHRHLGYYQSGCCPLASNAREGLVKIVRKKEKIKIGYCSIGMREEKIEDIIPRLAALGYEGIELWYPHVEDYEKRRGELESLKKLLDEQGLAVIMVVPYFNLTGSKEEREESYKTAGEAVRYAKIFRTPFVRAFVGGPASGKAGQEEWERAVKGLQRICDLDREIHFLLETHDHQLQDTVATTLKLLRKTGRDNLGVNLDIFNLFMMGEDPVAALKFLHPAVKNVHVKNRNRQAGGNWETAFLKDGDLDYQPFFRALQSMGYNGFVSLEWFGPSPLPAAEKEYHYLKALL